jgi:hypothetical protein
MTRLLVSFQSAEIGNVLVLPPFRRTYVLTHALSLFFTWCFTPPTTPSTAALLNKGPGLGLRRVQVRSRLRKPYAGSARADLDLLFLIFSHL